MHLPIAIKLLIFASLVSQPASDDLKRCYQRLGQDCYYVLNKRYPGLEEFELFWVEKIDRANYSMRGAAYVNKTFYRFEGRLKKNRMSFDVSMNQGLSYRFVGTFVPGGRAAKALELLLKADSQKRARIRMSQET